jgi:hypothetical protein
MCYAWKPLEVNLIKFFYAPYFAFKYMSLRKTQHNANMNTKWNENLRQKDN